ncbi:hypothetical protein L208DRAFT_1377016 [Tricholoma matsutake]|nr:hypothetical protein L208DRAFT_1377016 [Tricholoma matsutake 945]
MDTLSVSVNIPGFSMVILFGDLPTDTNELVQKTGQVGQDKKAGVQAWAIIYYPRTIIAMAEKVVVMAEQSNTIQAASQAPGSLDLGIVEILLAKCKPAVQNCLNDNPVEVVFCSCLHCTSNLPPPPLAVYLSSLTNLQQQWLGIWW